MYLRSHSRDCARQTPWAQLRMRPITRWKMWIQLLCVCVLYPMGSREFSWPYMGIVTSIWSPDLYARFWLVEKIFATLWLVRTYCSLFHYWHRFEYDQNGKVWWIIDSIGKFKTFSSNLFFNMNPLGAYFINQSHNPGKTRLPKWRGRLYTGYVVL